MPKISLYSPLEVTLQAVASDESYKPDGKEYHVRARRRPTPDCIAWKRSTAAISPASSGPRTCRSPSNPASIRRT